MESGQRKQRVGTVVSDKMDRSIVVAVLWSRRHRVYGKPMRRITKFMAHDPESRASVGDVVRIEETRPLSKTKRWRLVEVVREVQVAEVKPTEVDPEAGAGGNEQ